MIENIQIEELYKQMAQSIIDGEAEIAVELAQKSIELNMHPLDTITKGFVVGVNYIGDQFGKGEAFLPELVMQLFREEQHLPSSIIDRDSTRAWKEAGSLDAFGRAKVRVNQLLASYQRPKLDPIKENQLHAFMLDLSQKAGLEQLPMLEDFQPV